MHSIILRSFSAFSTEPEVARRKYNVFISREIFSSLVIYCALETFHCKECVRLHVTGFASDALDSSLGLDWLMREGLLILNWFLNIGF